VSASLRLIAFVQVLADQRKQSAVAAVAVAYHVLSWASASRVMIDTARATDQRSNCFRVECKTASASASASLALH
jgi:hypothetical protein